MKNENSNKRALITGITGQDGSYLAELLTEKGYEVHGTVRRVALDCGPAIRMSRIAHIPGIVLHSASMESAASIFRAVQVSQPHEVYHLAAQSFVSDSFEDAETTLRVNALGTMHVLDAVRAHAPDARVYFAATSEMFGRSVAPQNEHTSFDPVSPYAISKLTGYYLCQAYRAAHGLRIACGILFNHESPRRGPEFVTRKITRAVAAMALGHPAILELGNVAAMRDWGHARDYVRAMWMMLHDYDSRDRHDFVIATGETRTVHDFVEAAFRAAGMDYRGRVKFECPDLRRPTDIAVLRGDASEARRILGWCPSVTFEGLVREMVNADIARLK